MKKKLNLCHAKLLWYYPNLLCHSCAHASHEQMEILTQFIDTVPSWNGAAFLLLLTYRTNNFYKKDWAKMLQHKKRKTLIHFQPDSMSNMVHFIIRFAARQLFLFVVKNLNVFAIEIFEPRIKKNSIQKLRTCSKGELKYWNLETKLVNSKHEIGDIPTNCVWLYAFLPLKNHLHNTCLNLVRCCSSFDVQQRYKRIYSFWMFYVTALCVYYFES